MKNLVILSTFVLFVFACKNADQFRAPIETLVADWAKTATMVGEVSAEVNNTISGLTSMTDSMVVAPGTKLAADATTMLDSLKNSYTAQVQGLGALTTEINAFNEKWTAMTADVDSLSAGLKAGNLTGDVMAKINSLNEAITGANTAAETWKSTAAATKEAAMGLYNMYKEKAMGK
ncbi:MAG: hypothetical protein IPM48_04745 [Saprospiraceae bacterium]|nr:hypothetical protein [Saprospiraceae bacterium]